MTQHTRGIVSPPTLLARPFSSRTGATLLGLSLATALSCRVAMAADAAAASKAASPATAVATAPAGARVEGVIRADVPSFRLTVLSSEGTQQIDGANGRATVAAGTYNLLRWKAEAKDAAGRRWQARGGVQRTPIVVAPGGVTTVRLASPLRAVLRGFYRGNPLGFRLEFAGSEGELIEGVTLDDRPPPLPRLRISDGKGTLIAELPFKPG
jgi:hypothetical protein